MSIWIKLPDYDHLSYQGQYSCSVCGSSETPKPIFRPPTFDEFDGFTDVCPNCIRDAAAELGMVEPKALRSAQEVAGLFSAELSDLQEQLQQARDAQASLARENVRLQDLLDEFEDGMVIPMPDEFFEGIEDDSD